MADNGHVTQLEWIRMALNRYEGPLMRYAHRLTGDLERARDVVQETFLQLCRQERVQIDGHLAQWLFTVCRNSAFDIRRKEYRMTTLGEDVDREAESREPAPAQVAEQRDATQRVLELLDRLPENQQAVIRLKFQNGFSYRQISGVTGLSVTNVGFLIHRGLATLRKQMK